MSAPRYYPPGLPRISLSRKGGELQLFTEIPTTQPSTHLTVTERSIVQQPKVSVVMLMSPGREAMQCRALRAIKEQTYQNIEVVVFDTSHLRGKTIGYMRNVANAEATGELIAHADDDDISHPRRLEEQVALLLASGKQCVGYRELLFWDTRPLAHECSYDEREGGCPVCADEDQRQHEQRGEAWLYRNPDPRWAAGASFLMRRELWERQPFPDAPHEDQRWWCTPLVSRNCMGVSALSGLDWPSRNGDHPRMICQIHGDSTEKITLKVRQNNPDVWKRVPEFDSYCERTMNL